MAFVSNNSQQLSLMDSTFNLTERERKFLGKIMGQKLLQIRFFQL